MPYDEQLTGRIRKVVLRREGFVEKEMFGGVAFLFHGNMCFGVHKEDLVLRLGPQQGQQALEQPHVRPFDITGRPMKGWVMVSPDGMKDDASLTKWINRAIEFVSTLPKKQ